jgi:hypothetical protein
MWVQQGLKSVFFLPLKSLFDYLGMPLTIQKLYLISVNIHSSLSPPIVYSETKIVIIMQT